MTESQHHLSATLITPSAHFLDDTVWQQLMTRQVRMDTNYIQYNDLLFSLHMSKSACHHYGLIKIPYSMFQYRESAKKICWLQCTRNKLADLQFALQTHLNMKVQSFYLSTASFVSPVCKLSCCFLALNASLSVRKKQMQNFIRGILNVEEKHLLYSLFACCSFSQGRRVHVLGRSWLKYR